MTAGLVLVLIAIIIIVPLFFILMWVMLGMVMAIRHDERVQRSGRQKASGPRL